MIRRRHEFQILNVVVRFVPIFVVDMEPSRDRTIEPLIDEPMRPNIHGSVEIISCPVIATEHDAEEGDALRCFHTRNLAYQALHINDFIVIG